MKLKKTWFGWINFGLGCILLGVFLFTLFVSLLEYNHVTMFLFSQSWLRLSFVISVFAIAAIVGLYIVLHCVKKKFVLNEKAVNGIVSGILFWLAFTAILAYGVFLRYTAVKEAASLTLTDQTYFERIMSIVSGFKPDYKDPLTLIYCYFGSFIVKVFGIRTSGLFAVNAVFTVLGSIFLFYALKAQFGRIEALCGFGFLMLMPASVNYDLSVTPDCMLFFVGSFVVMTAGFVIGDWADGSMESNMNVILFVLFGLIFGGLLFLEPAFIVLPVYFLLKIILMDVDSVRASAGILSDDETRKAINGRLLPGLVLGLTTAFTSVYAVYARGLLTEGSFMAELNNYLSKFGYSEFVRLFYPAGYLIECIIIVAFCLLAYIGFIFKKDDRISASGFAFLILFFAYAKRITSTDLSIYLILYYGLFLGIGVRGFCLEGYRKAEDIEEEELLKDSSEDDGIEKEEVRSLTEEKSADEPSALPEEITPVESAEVPEEAVPVKAFETSETTPEENETATVNVTAGETASAVTTAETLTEEVTDTVNETTADTATETPVYLVTGDDNDLIFIDPLSEETARLKAGKETERVRTKKEFKPIENVIPLPKKHVKKNMDFAVEPSSDKMKFDIEIKDNDDFDYE